MRSRPWLIAWMLVACADDPPPDLRGPPPSELPCVVPCRQGFECSDGACVPICEPACPAGLICSTGRRCVPDTPDGFVGANACAGFGTLEGRPGEACGPCDTGIWLCESDDRVVCVDPIGLNECGSCQVLPGAAGQECEADGLWRCQPDGSLACVAAPERNACGGLDVLEGIPGRSCGDCDEGYWRCDGRTRVVCETGETNNGCDCARGPAVIECGTDAGRCTRGIRVCQPSGRYSACVEAAIGSACTTDADCGGGFCVDERLGSEENLDDACRPTDGTCEQKICRTLAGTRGCADNSDCAPTQGCASGFCYDLAVRGDIERCNGIDDDCDGRIDNDEDRATICGLCPYNMLLGVKGGGRRATDLFCIDRYEASRPDASAESAGGVGHRAQSRAGVLPWTSVTAAGAREACAGVAYDEEVPGGVATKRLCLEAEWRLGCADESNPFPYGALHEAAACNDGSAGGALRATADTAQCVYEMPPGFFTIFDMIGNAAEWIRADDRVALAGGGFNDPPERARCDAIANPPDLAGPFSEDVGFRCCASVDRGAF